MADAVGRSAPPRGAPSRTPGVRHRWVLGLEARVLVVLTIVLVGLGHIVLYSASALQVDHQQLVGHHYVVKQAQGALAGGLLLLILSRVDAEWYRRLAWPGMLLALVLMAVLLLPGMKTVNGSRRYLFGNAVQPSELAKLALCAWVPMLIVRKGERLRELGKGMLPFALVVGSLCLLAALEPDHSAAMLYCLITGVLLFVAGARWRHFVLFGLVGVLALGTLAAQSGHVRDRMRAFAGSAQPAAERQRVGLQQDQSKIAVGSGGAFGVGLGRGNQQRGWLPLPYNDFIGSVIGEEFGFAGLAFCTLAFAVYGFLGFQIAAQARTPYLGLLAVGLTTVTVVTALVHLAVVVDALPNTGLTLPFVSYGRSNLVLTLAMTGILVNIGSTRERVYGAGATDPLAGPRARAALA